MQNKLRALSLAGTAGLTSAVLLGNWFATPLHAFAATKTKKYTGSWVDQRWGPVRAVIYVKGKTITKVSIGTTPENPRSQFIDSQAVPLLKQETLQVQKASQVQIISGATMTSEAYITSLTKVMKKAHLKVS